MMRRGGGKLKCGQGEMTKMRGMVWYGMGVN